MVLFFYLKLVFLFVAIKGAQLKGKKRLVTYSLSASSRYVSYHVPNVSIFFFAHCFIFFKQMTIIYLSFSVVDIFGPVVVLFKCLDFKTFCFVVIYIIVAKKLFIYKKLY